MIATFTVNNKNFEKYNDFGVWMIRLLNAFDLKSILFLAFMTTLKGQRGWHIEGQSCRAYQADSKAPLRD